LERKPLIVIKLYLNYNNINQLIYNIITAIQTKLKCALKSREIGFQNQLVLNDVGLMKGRGKSQILYLGSASEKHRLLIKRLSLGGADLIATGIAILENESIQHWPK